MLLLFLLLTVIAFSVQSLHKIFSLCLRRDSVHTYLLMVVLYRFRSQCNRHLFSTYALCILLLLSMATFGSSIDDHNIHSLGTTFIQPTFSFCLLAFKFAFCCCVNLIPLVKVFYLPSTKSKKTSATIKHQ